MVVSLLHANVMIKVMEDGDKCGGRADEGQQMAL